MADRSIELIEELDQQLRGLEDQQLRKLRGIFDEALRRTIRSLTDRLERIAEQPEYDPATTPGAFLGSTPGGPEPITPLQKNQASLYLQGQLAQDLQVIVNRFPADRAANAALNRELSELYNRAQDLGTEYAIELSREMLPPAAVLSGRHPALQDPQLPPAAPPAPTDAPPPGSPYQEGQSFTRLLNLGATIAASERDFKTLSANYRRQRNAATSERVRASKDYFFRWWRDWGDTVQFETAAQLATGVDSRQLARTLKQRLPHINDAFRNRAETVARTETHIAAGEARERTFRRVGAGFVRFVPTADDRVCEFCAPRMGCLYYAGSVKTPIHPNCRCALSPITLEALVIQNQLASSREERWEAQQQALAAATREKFEQANGIRPYRPIGGTGEPRGHQDYPLMERTALPATTPRPNQANNPANGGARPWPSGDPVWTPSRGWINAAAREAYDAMVLEVAELDL
jgi:SPP1 gp7 family putative phage head morphogenesis protein